MRMDLKNQRVLVIGAARSGIGAVHLLHTIGARPVLLEQNEKAERAKIIEQLPKEDREAVEVIVGALPEDMSSQLAAVVPSPAVPLDTDFIGAFRKRGIPVWSEVELAFRYAKGRLIAITGTNGKTTTTTLVGEIMKAVFGDASETPVNTLENSGPPAAGTQPTLPGKVYVVGNIGHSYAGVACDIPTDAVTVAEISSFQLEAIDAFHANVAAVLNVTPDHLNRHHTMECYAAMKERVANRQTAADTCVLNYDNPYTRAMGERLPARVVWFSSTEKLEDGLYLDGEEIVQAENGKTTRLLDVREMHLVGVCNAENVMAAIAIARAMDVPMETILRVVRDFRAVEHRIEFVAAKGGVDYYNDSKATNPDAAIQGIRAMRKKTVLIGGGYDKDNTYDEWIESFDGKVKALVLIGATKEKIAACARAHGFQAIHFADSFNEALRLCTRLTAPGEAVLLSPACASWGMFKDYEERGRMFKAYVNALED